MVFTYTFTSPAYVTDSEREAYVGLISRMSSIGLNADQSPAILDFAGYMRFLYVNNELTAYCSHYDPIIFQNLFSVLGHKNPITEQLLTMLTEVQLLSAISLCQNGEASPRSVIEGFLSEAQEDPVLESIELDKLRAIALAIALVSDTGENCRNCYNIREGMSSEEILERQGLTDNLLTEIDEEWRVPLNRA